MKRLLLIFLLFQAITSCNKILDKTPIDTVDPDNFYQSEEELNMALAAVYDPLGHENIYGSALWFQFGICTDEAFYAFTANAYSAPMFYQFDYTNPYVNNLWQQCYVGIERANMLIENVHKPVMDETKRQAILGEALFLRAYYHFLLVSNYGKAPLKLQSSKDVNTVNVPAASATQLYEQIVADMKEAETKVNKITAIGNSSHVSKTAVRGILARVYLYMAGYPLRDQSKYADALFWSKKVDEDNEHALNTAYDATITNSPYSQIFINHSRDIYDIKECIWEVDFNAFQGNPTYAEMGKVGTMNLACTNADTGQASGNIKTTIKLYRLYGNGDQRRDWAIAPFTYSTTMPLTRNNVASGTIIGRDMGKWRRYYEPTSFVKSQYLNGTNFPLLRYSDVLLMQAEAEFRVNGATPVAYEALNKVRRRAYGLPVNVASTVADLTPTNIAPLTFEQVIQDERARELCFEGLRKQDLIRWGIFTSTMTAIAAEINGSNASFTNKSRWMTGYNSAASSSRYLLLPIPSLEMSVNKAIDQNEGW